MTSSFWPEHHLKTQVLPARHEPRAGKRGAQVLRLMGSLSSSSSVSETELSLLRRHPNRLGPLLGSVLPTSSREGWQLRHTWPRVTREAARVTAGLRADAGGREARPTVRMHPGVGAAGGEACSRGGRAVEAHTQGASNLRCDRGSQSPLPAPAPPSRGPSVQGSMRYSGQGLGSSLPSGLDALRSLQGQENRRERNPSNWP